jgi:hypothetical protein
VKLLQWSDSPELLELAADEEAFYDALSRMIHAVPRPARAANLPAMPCGSRTPTA